MAQIRLAKSLPTKGTDPRIEQIKEILQRFERRDRWLLPTAIVISVMLTTTVVSILSFRTMTGTHNFFRLNLSQHGRGFVGLILLFDIYIVYQQVRVKRFLRKLAEQMIVEAGLRTRAEEWEKIATVDPLTGLYSTRFLKQRLATEVARSHRFGYPLTVVLLEVDGFARITELWGQSVARMVLRQFGQKVAQVARASDEAISLGNGEFMLLLPECPVEEVPQLLKRFGSPEVELSGQKIAIPFSVRLAECRPGELPRELFQRAEHALRERGNPAPSAGVLGPRGNQVE